MDHKTNTSPAGSRTSPKDLNDVELIGSPNPSRPGRPEVHHTITNERDHRQTHPDKSEHDHHPDSDAETVPTQPLLPGRDPQRPPLADPEIDDIDDEKSVDHTPYPGIDDGLLDQGDKMPNGHPGNKDPENHDAPTDKHGEDGDTTTEDGKWWPHDGGDEPDGPYGVNGFPKSGFDYDPADRAISPAPGSTIFDVNTYQQKKNLAQGMMDLALLSANANQLRYVLESSTSHAYFYPSIVFISLSIILQIAVGVGLILNSRYNVHDDKDNCKADKVNNLTVLGVFLVTIVNVFITSFSVATPPVAVPKTP